VRNDVVDGAFVVDGIASEQQKNRQKPVFLLLL
jgi:hypothetical protein